MKSLELRIPPPLILVASGAVMWGIAAITPRLTFGNTARLFASWALVVLGVAVVVAGVLSFRLARTTINPLQPQATAVLVTSGIYTLTRNPMYVGMLLALAGWGVYLAAPVALVGLLGFWLYIGRLQIAPEERVLEAMFGAEYRGYCRKVRRWL